MMEWPYARVLAEVVAWPFCAPDAFQFGLVALERSSEGHFDGKTAKLALGLQEHLRLRAGGVSLEALRQTRDFAWFGSAERIEPRRLVDLLLHTAQRHLAIRGGHVVLKSHDTERAEETAHRFRWMTLSLPRDLLIAAIEGERLSPDCLLPDDPEHSLDLQALLGKGLTQIHTHLSACLSFEAIWTHLMASTGQPTVDEGRLDRWAVPFGDRAIFMSWLAIAGLARLSLAGFLWQRESQKSSQSLVEFLHRVQFDGSIERMEHMQALSSLSRGQTPQPASRVRAAYRRFLRTTSALPSSASQEELAKADPLSHCFPGHGPWPESTFCGAALRYIRDQDDRAFERIFWQYQRIRCATYRFVTQEPGTRGLDWFVRFFRRISPLRRGIDTRVLMDSAIMFQQGPGAQPSARLDKIEVRIAPLERWNKLKQEITAIDGARRPRCDHNTVGFPPLERGVVLHFQKDSLDIVPELPRHGGSHGDGLRFVRFGRYYRGRRKQAHAFDAMLMADPALLYIVRGLDICGQELSTPTWVLLPLLKQLRKRSKDLADRSEQNSYRLHSLRMTLHAGEDFRVLLEGVRRIHEPFEFWLLEQRDRIGHAVALGVDPQAWARSHPVAYQPSEERLDDILWLLNLENDRKLITRNKLKLLSEAYCLAETIYAPLPDSISQDEIIAALIAARQMRHCSHVLSSWNYPDLDPKPKLQSHAANFLFRYLTDYSVWRRGQKPCEVRSTRVEMDVLRQAQAIVLDAIRGREITIEANPTSNLLIADLGALEGHPMFRLSARSWSQLLKRPQRIALSDDDPLTFATSLISEYAYTYYALRRQGRRHCQAIQWLEQRRQDARAASFTLPESAVWPPQNRGRSLVRQDFKRIPE